MDWSELTLLMPVGVILTAALIVVFLDLALPRNERYLLQWSALAGCVLGLVSALQTQWALWGKLAWFLTYDKTFPAGANPLKLGGAFCVDGFGMVIWVIACLAGALSILCSPPPTEEHSALSSGEYYGLTLLAVAGMMLLAVSHDFLTLLISLEIMSISTYILTGGNRESFFSNEAAIKYLVLGAFSTAFLLMGIAFYYGAFGMLSLTPGNLSGADAANRGAFVILAMGLIFVGALFKIGAAPFHFWIPDVYQGAPTAITGLMAVGVKAAAFAVAARLAFETFGAPELRGQWLKVLELSAVLTMAVGNIFAMRQGNIKRMLAYSAIAHTGYLLLALLVNSGDSGVMHEHLKAMVFYLLVYGVMTLGAFGVIGLLRQDGKPLEEMANFRGLAKGHPGIALCMAIFMLSLAGMPPLGGFFAKFMIFRGAVAEGHVTAAVIGILTSVASLYYYLRVVVEMYMSPANEEAPAPGVEAARCQDTWSSNLLIYGAGAVTVVLGVMPGWFY